MELEAVKGFSVFVAGVVIKNKKVLLLHRKDPDVWEFPAGKIRYGEHPSATAKREVKEESGLNVKVEKILAIGSTIRSDKQHEIVLTFLCKPKSQKVRIGEPDHSEYGWFSLGEMKRLKNLATSVQSVLRQLSAYLR